MPPKGGVGMDPCTGLPAPPVMVAPVLSKEDPAASYRQDEPQLGKNSSGTPALTPVIAPPVPGNGMLDVKEESIDGETLNRGLEASQEQKRRRKDAPPAKPLPRSLAQRRQRPQLHVALPSELSDANSSDNGSVTPPFSDDNTPKHPASKRARRMEPTETRVIGQELALVEQVPRVPPPPPPPPRLRNIARSTPRRELPHGERSRIYATVRRRNSSLPLAWPLMVGAAFNNDTESVRQLIEADANVNAMTANRGTALWYAVQNDQPEIVRLLLSARADPNHTKRTQKGTWRTLLDMAILEGISLEIGRSLLDAGAKRGVEVLQGSRQRFAVGGGPGEALSPEEYIAAARKLPSQRMLAIADDAGLVPGIREAGVKQASAVQPSDDVDISMQGLQALPVESPAREMLDDGDDARSSDTEEIGTALMAAQAAEARRGQEEDGQEQGPDAGVEEGTGKPRRQKGGNEGGGVEEALARRRPRADEAEGRGVGAHSEATELMTSSRQRRGGSRSRSEEVTTVNDRDREGSSSSPSPPMKMGSAFAARRAFRKAYSQKFLPLSDAQPVIDYSAYERKGDPPDSESEKEEDLPQKSLNPPSSVGSGGASRTASRRCYAGIDLGEPGQLRGENVEAERARARIMFAQQFRRSAAVHQPGPGEDGTGDPWDCRLHSRPTSSSSNVKDVKEEPDDRTEGIGVVNLAPSNATSSQPHDEGATPEAATAAAAAAATAKAAEAAPQSASQPGVAGAATLSAGVHTPAPPGAAPAAASSVAPPAAATETPSPLQASVPKGACKARPSADPATPMAKPWSGQVVPAVAAAAIERSVPRPRHPGPPAAGPSATFSSAATPPTLGDGLAPSTVLKAKSLPAPKGLQKCKSDAGKPEEILAAQIGAVPKSGTPKSVPAASAAAAPRQPRAKGPPPRPPGPQVLQPQRDSGQGLQAKAPMPPPLQNSYAASGSAGEPLLKAAVDTDVIMVGDDAPGLPRFCDEPPVLHVDTSDRPQLTSGGSSPSKAMPTIRQSRPPSGSFASGFAHDSFRVQNEIVKELAGGSARFDPAREPWNTRNHATKAVLINVKELKFCHATISPVFTHGQHRGKAVLALLTDLHKGRIDPRSLPPLVVMHSARGNECVCGNRRLYCLKRYQIETGKDVDVWCMVYDLKSEQTPRALVMKYILAKTSNDGNSIDLRPQRA